MSINPEFGLLIELATKRRLHVEGHDILFSEEQGGADALVCVDRWLCWRENAIRLQVRVIARSSAPDEWVAVSEGQFSDPLSFEQAAQMVEHWSVLDRSDSARRRASDSAEADRLDAFGPRPPVPR